MTSDGHFYAVKKITQTSASALSGVLSEIILLSRLNHPNVVRYFTAWIEDEGPREGSKDPSCATADESISALGGSDVAFGQSTGGLDFISSSGFPKIEFGYDSGEDDTSSEAVDDDESSSEDETEDYSESPGGEQRQGLGTASSDADARLGHKRSYSHVQSTRTTLFIQMEYCENKVCSPGASTISKSDHIRLCATSSKRTCTRTTKRAGGCSDRPWRVSLTYTTTASFIETLSLRTSL